jgi:hypothetical protein
MTNFARLVVEPAVKTGRVVRLSSRLVHADGSLDRLWWEVPHEWSEALTPWTDPWVVGLIFPIMQQRAPVHIEGRVSPSLLANLELFMRIWERWAPGRYHSVPLISETAVELPPVQEPDLAITSFSCGVDSCFTAYRHSQGLAGRLTRRLGAAVVQHGFDVWLGRSNSDEVYATMLGKAASMLASLGLPCIPLKTNFQQLRLDWAHAWGTQQVSGLYLFAGRFDTALIANDLPYDWLGITWASHPVTNALMGSRGFKVIDDGGDYTRAEKAGVIAAWPDAMKHLHVCFGEGIPDRYENCCKCEKCVRTILAFRIVGRPKPESFRYDVTDAQVRAMRLRRDTRKNWERLAHGADNAGLGSTSWAKAIRAALRKQQYREVRNVLQKPFVPLRNAIRKLVRGTALSRSERARNR